MGPIVMLPSRSGGGSGHGGALNSRPSGFNSRRLHLLKGIDCLHWESTLNLSVRRRTMKTVAEVLKEYVVYLREEESLLHGKWQEAVTKLEAAERTALGCPEWLELKSQEPVIDPIVSRIKKCKTQKEALYEIARMCGGQVKAKEASKLMMAAGLTNGKLSSMASTVHRLLHEGDDWEYIEPGVFRFLGFATNADAEPHASSIPGARDSIPMT